MSIPQPGKGQPLDSSYISKIISSINDLYTKVASKFSNSQIDTKDAGKQIAKTTDLMIDAGYEVVTNGVSSTTSEQSQLHRFGSTFKTPPVVVATPMVDNTISGKVINTYVKDVTTTSATIVVQFGTVDTTSVTINVIAIGIPAIS